MHVSGSAAPPIRRAFAISGICSTFVGRSSSPDTKRGCEAGWRSERSIDFNIGRVALPSVPISQPLMASTKTRKVLRPSNRIGCGFAAAHESESGPVLPTCAMQQVGSYLGYTGLDVGVVARAASDPLRDIPQTLWSPIKATSPAGPRSLRTLGKKRIE